jgi:signal peptidase I
MSPPPPDNGDHPAVLTGGRVDFPVERPASGPATGFGRHTRGVAPPRVSVVRSPQERDYRLRGLSTDPADYVPSAPVRPDRRRRPRRRGPLLAKTAVLLLVAGLAAWLLQAFVVRPFAVPGTAMAPTLQPGDRILVARPGILGGPVRSGQVVVVRAPQFLPCTVGGSGADLVLRVVGGPGQTIWSIGNTIFVDGRPLRERGWYDRRSGPVGSRPIRSTTLTGDRYYVLGDNRSAACDSRVFGPVPKSSIVGAGLAIVVRHGHVFLRKL